MKNYKAQKIGEKSRALNQIYPSHWIRWQAGSGIFSTLQAGGKADNHFKIFTEKEALEVCKEEIKQGLFFFDIDFLVESTGLTRLVIKDLLQSFDFGTLDDINSIFLHLIELKTGLDNFVVEAISRYGRGFFLSSDNEEISLGDFFAYRID